MKANIKRGIDIKVTGILTGIYFTQLRISPIILADAKCKGKIVPKNTIKRNTERIFLTFGLCRKYKNRKKRFWPFSEKRA
jgi:hypothetical protein